MSTLPIAFAQKFKGDFLLLSQQKTSRLRAYVRDDPDQLDGKSGHFNRIGPTTMTKRTSRHQDTNLTEHAHSRRRVTMDDWEHGALIDRQDIQRMIENPMSSYHRNAVMAKNRNIDDVILAAVNGNAYSMDAADTATQVALPAAQKIAHGGVGLTIAKVIQIVEMFNAAEVDENEEKVITITAKQWTDLLGITEFKSNDYNAGKPLMTGPREMDWMGLHWVRSERLTLSGTARLCLAWARSGMGLAVGEECYIDISPRADKGNSNQLLVQQTLGATRIEDEKVIEIACTEA